MRAASLSGFLPVISSPSSVKGFTLRLGPEIPTYLSASLMFMSETLAFPIRALNSCSASLSLTDWVLIVNSPVRISSVADAILLLMVRMSASQLFMGLSIVLKVSPMFSFQAFEDSESLRLMESMVSHSRSVAPIALACCSRAMLARVVIFASSSSLPVSWS